jgi:hypothetical protein
MSSRVNPTPGTLGLTRFSLMRICRIYCRWAMPIVASGALLGAISRGFKASEIRSHCSAEIQALHDRPPNLDAIVNVFIDAHALVLVACRIVEEGNADE